ncbi:hypothetical protein BDW71DRAFT_135298 [Aspergillus fruticulosus]
MQRRLRFFFLPLPCFCSFKSVSLSSSLIFSSPGAPRSAPIPISIVSIARLSGPALPAALAVLSLLLVGRIMLEVFQYEFLFLSP